MINQYYIGVRNQINDDYDSLGVIDDYLTDDIDIQSAAVVYDFNMNLHLFSFYNKIEDTLFSIRHNI